ncbi:hypothetical protein AAVH_25740 [Aphelenchoides avenae]|nr:hypothetical protein AAVH_40943 [Aphelenchus avenae]KAH7707024.1 hypothetical protein AAVH_25740 [Aphelenchus avenae]
MAGVGLFLSRTRNDVIFPAPTRPNGVAYALLRNVPRAEAIQRHPGPCPACDEEVPEADRRVHPHLFRAQCYYATTQGFCGPCFLASETNQALRAAFVHNYGPRCRLNTPARREAWAVGLGVLGVHETHEVHNWPHIVVPRGVEAPEGVQRPAAELDRLRKDLVLTLFGLVIP